MNPRSLATSLRTSLGRLRSLVSHSAKPRVTYIVEQFPQISETYIKSEIEAVQENFELLVVRLNKCDTGYARHAPFVHLKNKEAIGEAIDAFRPSVLHGHYLYRVKMLHELGAPRGIPYTVRAHSFDVMLRSEDSLRAFADYVNDDLCLGVLAFPFQRPTLERSGCRAEKIRDCFPVMNFPLFHDRSPNGPAVMNVGACIPKKKMEDFIELGTRMPGTEFNLYAMGYDVARIAALNDAAGRPVNLVPSIEPDDMPREYKKHRWLVYTGCRQLNSVGWPVAVAEAQAAGVLVCMPNLRPDLREYVGDAGYLYESIAQVQDIISKPVSEERRRLGFEQAKRSDIWDHRTLLTDLWRGAISHGRAS